jgi:hypothetical protein
MGISMLSLQRMPEIKSRKAVRTMGHKISQAMCDRDADYKLAGLLEMDYTYFGLPKPPGSAAVRLRARPEWWWLWKIRRMSPGLPACVWCPESVARRPNLW